ncbi:hypothetical protein DICVIV_08700 [Dictyocaulus viviparus]|uniref:Uncharacterized protein n=1 Tax=Dictyocaulus viviparus TaxID=29172 RepID=A0A0D8XSA8_DICVI|nr:hypothetical protein DICVIV_08700 [Dictyocaulus viviparus]
MIITSDGVPATAAHAPAAAPRAALPTNDTELGRQDNQFAKKEDRHRCTTRLMCFFHDVKLRLHEEVETEQIIDTGIQ